MNKKLEIKEVKEFLQIKNINKETNNIKFNLYTFKTLDNGQDLSEEWKLFLYKKYKNEYLNMVFSQIEVDKATLMNEEAKKIKILENQKHILFKTYKKNIKAFKKHENEFALDSLVDELESETNKLDNEISKVNKNLLIITQKMDEVKKSFIKITETNENVL